MIFTQPKNPNYSAIVTTLNQFTPLAGCDNVKGAKILGSQVILGNDHVAGEIGVYFPVETQLTREFLHANNLFRNSSLNSDTSVRGYFEEHGRVKCAKFRGHRSEGFWLPLTSLTNLGINIVDLREGDVFDEIDGHVICRKYTPRHNPIALARTGKVRTAKPEDRILPGQFSFHYDTTNLRRAWACAIHPSDNIIISDKWHGTSVIVGNLRTLRKLAWYERLLTRLGVRIDSSRYELVWSSRRVVKGVGVAKPNSQHYYKDDDVWGTVAKEIESTDLPKGITVYAEIVGFTPSGQPIQLGYHYGCQPNQHRTVVYRITSTNPDGDTIELSWDQMTSFCDLRGWETVKPIWVGRAEHFSSYQEDMRLEYWFQSFVELVEQTYVHDQTCSYNNHEVPAEGIVVRVERGLAPCDAWKLKNFRFLERESKGLDTGEVDMEMGEEEGV